MHVEVAEGDLPCLEGLRVVLVQVVAVVGNFAEVGAHGVAALSVVGLGEVEFPNHRLFLLVRPWVSCQTFLDVCVV